MACLLGILKLLDSDQRQLYKEYIDTYDNKHDLKVFNLYLFQESILLFLILISILYIKQKSQMNSRL